MRTPASERLHFKEKIALSSRNRSSRIVLAVDLDGTSPSVLFERGVSLIQETENSICAVKMGRQTVLNLGANRSRRLVALAHENQLPCIIDDKLNDIDETNRAISSAYFRLGFDAIIVNPFAGWEGGLEAVFELANGQRRGVIVLVYMSHPGASSSYGQRVQVGARVARQYSVFARKAKSWGADGVVAGATRPRVIEEVREILGSDIPIYSPGVGTQGGTVHSAIAAGTSYLIVGRSITASSSPSKAASRFSRMSRSAPSQTSPG